MSKTDGTTMKEQHAGDDMESKVIRITSCELLAKGYERIMKERLKWGVTRPWRDVQ